MSKTDNANNVDNLAVTPKTECLSPTVGSNSGKKKRARSVRKGTSFRYLDSGILQFLSSKVRDLNLIFEELTPAQQMDAFIRVAQIVYKRKDVVLDVEAGTIIINGVKFGSKPDKDNIQDAEVVE